jgi:hypothetical protein
MPASIHDVPQVRFHAGSQFELVTGNFALILMTTVRKL